MSMKYIPYVVLLVMIGLGVLYLTPQIAHAPTVLKEASFDPKVLDLSRQNLSKLQGDVFSQTQLERLDISSNNLTGALPAEIRHLANLKVLNASNNRMTGVPAEIGQLSKLEVLDLSNNQLTGLPQEIANLKNLKVLDLSGNNPSKQDLDVIQKALPDLQVIE